MQRQSVRVVVASEYPQVRSSLSGLIEREDGVDVVGRAQDASKALTLVKNLKPDVAVIDSYLPHAVGLVAIPLSRINGLDTAQAILEELPNIRVILLNNLDAGILPDRSLGSNAAVASFIESMGANISFAPQELGDEVVQPNAIVFASVEMKQREAQQQVTKMTDKVIFFGALGLAGGWVLTLTIILAPVGVPIALAGAAAVLLGLAGKPVTSWWLKIKGRPKADK